MSEKVKRQPKTGYRPSLWTRIAKTLRGKRSIAALQTIFFTALFLLIMGAFMALPLLYVILNAFKPMEELLLFPPKFLVYNPTLRNFSDLFSLMGETWVPFSRYVANTVFITATATFFHIAFSSMAAYALSKHTFFGSRVLFQLVVVALMFNGTVTAVPNYLLMSDLNWIDTCMSVIVPAIQGAVGPVFDEAVYGADSGFHSGVRPYGRRTGIPGDGGAS